MTLELFMLLLLPAGIFYCFYLECIEDEESSEDDMEA